MAHSPFLLCSASHLGLEGRRYQNQTQDSRADQEATMSWRPKQTLM